MPKGLNRIGIPAFHVDILSMIINKLNDKIKILLMFGKLLIDLTHRKAEGICRHQEGLER